MLSIGSLTFDLAHPTWERFTISMIAVVSALLIHPAFLALIPVIAIWIAYMRTSKKQTDIQIEVNGNMHTALAKIDTLTVSLTTALETIARLEKALGHKEGEEEAGHIGKSTNGGGH